MIYISFYFSLKQVLTFYVTSLKISFADLYPAFRALKETETPLTNVNVFRMYGLALQIYVVVVVRILTLPGTRGT